MANAAGFETYALSMRYGQRHSSELEAAKRVAAELGAKRHEIIDLDLRRFGGSALTDDARRAHRRRRRRNSDHLRAGAQYDHAVAGAWLGRGNRRTRPVFGANAVDYSGYPDCRPEYVAAYETLANLATKAGVEGDRFHVHAPIIDMTKAEIILAGVKLGVDYGLTVSCYKADDDGRACGVCDSCRIRRAGFEAAGVPDPTRYQTSN
jgi:7-cyano-7-deazaguanine synthase